MKQNSLVIIWFILFLHFLFAFKSNPLHAQEKPAIQPVLKKLIFLSFYNQDNKSIYRWIENSITDWIDIAAQKKYKYVKIPKSEWQKYLQDRKLGPEALFDEKILAQMGRDLGADGIIYGRFFRVKAEAGSGNVDTLTVEGKILSVIDREILASREVTSPVNSNLLDATDEVASYLANSIKDLFVPTDLGALWRTAVLPGWGYFYKQRPTWGYIYSGTLGTSFLVATIGFINFYIKRQDYLSYEPDKVITPNGETALIDPDEAAATFDELEGKANKAKKFAVNSALVFVSLYAINLLHAYFIDADSGNIRIASATGRNPAVFLALDWQNAYFASSDNTPSNLNLRVRQENRANMAFLLHF